MTAPRLTRKIDQIKQKERESAKAELDALRAENERLTAIEQKYNEGYRGLPENDWLREENERLTRELAALEELFRDYALKVGEQFTKQQIEIARLTERLVTWIRCADALQQENARLRQLCAEQENQP